MYEEVQALCRSLIAQGLAPTHILEGIGAAGVVVEAAWIDAQVALVSADSCVAAVDGWDVVRADQSGNYDREGGANSERAHRLCADPVSAAAVGDGGAESAEAGPRAAAEMKKLGDEERHHRRHRGAQAGSDRGTLCGRPNE